ncbi:MAG: DUF3991 and TOPRIM domain-containing protein [Clostridiales bacterium]|nr:DUF3991 and TOPRIM domain-containing protein [Clostridiales bacterium]
MSLYIHFTEEQKRTARQIDIAELLRSQGEIVKRSGSEYEWRNGSAKVTIRGNLWFHQYDRQGGDAIDFVRRFYNKSYPEAMEYLLSGSGGTLTVSPPIVRETKPFELPPKNENMRRVYAYLLNRRGIDKNVLNTFAYRQMIYESEKYHNVVFVGYDKDGVPRHAHKRGTGSESSYKGNADGSDPRYSFHWHGTSERLYLFEAPIDMLSFISMHKENWRDHSYAACCGVSDQVMWQMMKDNPHIEKVYLCLDNDEPGQQAAHRIREKLSEQGIQSEILVSIRKDWNEDRQAACANAPHKSAGFSISEESEDYPCPVLQL